MRRLFKMGVYGLMLALIASLIGCSSNAENGPPDPKTGFVTVHASTFKSLTSNSNQIAMLFANNTKALIASDLGDAEKLFLVDLTNNTKKTIDIPTNPRLFLSSMLYAGDEVLLWFRIRSEVDKDVAYVVNANGDMQQRQTYNFIHKTTADVIDIEPFLNEQNPQNLVNLREDICKFDNGSYNVTQTSIVEYFYNDQIAIKTNGDEVKAPLQARSVDTALDACERRTLETTANGYEIAVKRGVSGQSYESDLIQKIVSVEIKRNGQSIKTFDFNNNRADYYFYVVPSGNRVYFVGDSVKYFDVPN